MSILIPTHDSSAFIDQTLRSVRSQSFKRWEAIVVDNASDDDTLAIARRHAAEDPRIRVYGNAINVGPVANWIRCATLATSNLGGFLFSDDWYEPDFMAAAIEPLAHPDIGFVYAAPRIHFIDRREVKPARIAYRMRPGRHDTAEFLRGHYYDFGYSVPVSPGCALMRIPDLLRWLNATPRIRRDLGQANHGAGADVSVYLNACVEYPSFWHLDRPLVNFRSHSSNLTHGRNVRAAYVMTLKAFYDQHPLRMLSDSRVDASLWWAIRRDPLSGVLAEEFNKRAWYWVLYAAASGVIRRAMRMRARALAELRGLAQRRARGHGSQSSIPS